MNRLKGRWIMSAVGDYSLILVVDPDEESLAAMVKSLRGAGYHTAAAATFEEARRQLRVDPPRVLVSRARLEAYSGVHLALLARSLRSDCQSLILAEAPDPILEHEVTEAGAVFTLGPLTGDMLPSAIASIFGTQPCNPAAASAATLDVVMPTVELTPAIELASTIDLSSVPSDRRIGERRQVPTPGFEPERRVGDRRRSAGAEEPRVEEAN